MPVWCFRKLTSRPGSFKTKTWLSESKIKEVVVCSASPNMRLLVDIFVHEWLFYNKTNKMTGNKDATNTLKRANGWNSQHISSSTSEDKKTFTEKLKISIDDKMEITENPYEIRVWDPIAGVLATNLLERYVLSYLTERPGSSTQWKNNGLQKSGLC